MAPSKNGDRIFTVNEYDGTTVAGTANVSIARMAGGKYALIVETTLPQNIQPPIQFKGGDSYLANIIARSGVVGATDAPLKTMLPLVMTTAELLANGTPEGSAPAFNPTFTETSLEAYSVGSQIGYIRDKNPAASATPPVAEITSSMILREENGFQYWAVRVAIEAAIVGAFAFLYVTFLKKGSGNRKGQYVNK